MQATKATAPLFLVAGLVAFALTRPKFRPRTRRPRRDLGFAAVSAFVTAALLYSSFGTHLRGVADAFAAYTNAFTRFGAAAAPTGHEKPWWYYLRLFGWFRAGGLVWHQLPFAVLAVAGLVAAFVGRDPFIRGAALYTVFVAGAFSAFAYKTPWQSIHFVPGLAILATAALIAISRLRTGRLVALAFTLIVAATLFQQTSRAAFLRPADQRNPYAYVHSSPDVLKYRAIAEAAVTAHPDQPIRVISEEYWPLPWYLRGVPRVGFHSEPPENCDGALVITSATQADAVRAKLRGHYRESFLGLRPGFVCILFIAEP